MDDKKIALRAAAARMYYDEGKTNDDFRDIIEFIDNAEPVKRGQWIYGENEDGQDGIFCSECGHFVPWYYDYYDKADNLINDNPRCPNCGARTDGGAD